MGTLKTMFPDIPLLGVTATATTKVIVDIQKMLNLQQPVVLKAEFNRPNLYYHVCSPNFDSLSFPFSEKLNFFSKDKIG